MTSPIHLSVLVGFLGNFLPSRGLQVVGHPGVVGEHGGGGSDFGAHVADGAHAGAGDGVNALAVVLHNGSGQEKMERFIQTKMH